MDKHGTSTVMKYIYLTLIILFSAKWVTFGDTHFKDSILAKSSVKLN